MPVHNSDIARLFRETADLLDIQEANQFRIRAYRNAARSIETHDRQLRGLVAEGQDLTQIEGIGKDLAAKIKQIVESGELEQLQQLKQEFPSGLLELLNIEGLGPKRVKALYQELGIENWQELKTAAEDERIRNLDGFGPKIEQKILDKIINKSGRPQRTLRSKAMEVVEPLLDYLQQHSDIKQTAVAGSYRRKLETVGDIDILATGTVGKTISQHFVDYEDAERIISQGETKASVVLKSGLQVDLRIVKADSFGAALQYFTGSKQHNIKLRQRAIDQGCKLNEYGLFTVDDNQQQAGENEAEIYSRLGLSWIEPELREDQGEIKSAAADNLPQLVALGQIKGDLQAHTQQSDGVATLAEMADAAQERGYEYLAVTDHSQHLKVAHGLTPERYQQQAQQIDQYNQQQTGFRILKSAEVDILKDGSLDLDEETLQKFDIVLGAVHSYFDLNETEQTERIITAFSDPHFHIFAHPTGRLINSREPYALDMEKLLKAAKQQGVILEINAQPNRLDLDDRLARLAKQIGVKLSLGTDAHRTSELRYMQFGVDQARRGWLEADDIVNTRSWPQLKELLR